MRLGRAGCAANTVAARSAAQKHDHIARGRTLTAHVVSGGGGDNSAALHALGDIAVVIQLRNMAGRQTDLVAVRGISGGSSLRQLALGQLAG